MTLESTVRARPPAAGARRPAAGRRIGSGALLAVGLALFLAVSSCATVPHLSVPSGTALTALLPSDAFAYASIRVAANHRLVSDIIQKSGLKKSIPPTVLDKTSRLFASAQLDAAGKPSFSIVGQGSYPVGLIGFRLDLSGAWKRSATPLPWWQERNGDAQIALPSKSLLMVSNGRLPTMLSNLRNGAPETLNPTIVHAFEASDLSVYFPNVGSNTPLFGKAAARFPIQSFYLSIDARRATPGASEQKTSQTAAIAAEGSAGGTSPAVGTAVPSYHGFAVFKMNSDRDARLFSVVFKLLIASSETGGAIRGFPIPLAGARLSIDGNTIRLQGISVSESELADLLSAVIGGKGVGA